MAYTLHCTCLCHGSDGNRITDNHFSCKNCYAANHMGKLPREAHEDAPRSKKKKVSAKPAKQFTPSQAGRITVALKEAVEAAHVCGDGATCQHG